MTDFKADYSGAEVIASPNHGERVDIAAPDTIILHYTGMPSEDAAISWLCNPESQVSSHYLVRENGDVVQMVSESRRAWHAGKSFWAGATDINSRSIGIEIANAGHPSLPDYPQEQIESVAQLCLDCAKRWSITPERVLAHSDIAPVRKVDPGEHFPWDRLHQMGVGHWVEPAPMGGGRFFSQGDRGQPIEALQSMLSFYGYNIEINGEFNAETVGVVKSFQLHFRQARVDGVADSSTIDTLHRLLVSLPRFA
ncbi:N-acetylmuramoyl-L-alanine amidase [Rhizobium oryziradicis]|uniref:N-acetylmuramoyl-L-alanine amidase n=1 Tax=Rhizobium oryziradicis TaxID=1867956 RepID=A0A1Q8ZRA5_9HYPH|nr:N-acetylmuramoyl-L-alanine amidase [Rhizobium oryziradicis]OLP44490.1 N-acetylmuramoyl-L-alanine amidase [Rhizobium oryziradicis]